MATLAHEQKNNKTRENTTGLSGVGTHNDRETKKELAAWHKGMMRATQTQKKGQRNAKGHCAGLVLRLRED